MSIEANRGLLDEYIAAFNAGDLAHANGLLTREYFGYDPQAGEPTAPESFSQIAQALRGAFPDLRLRLDEVAESGDELTGRMSLEGTFTGSLWGVPGDGKLHSLSGTGVARFKDGRFAVRWEGLNLVGSLREMGLAPTPDKAHLKPIHPVRLPEIIQRLAFNGMQLQEKTCSHLGRIKVTQPATHVCQQCVDSGDEWPALRMCLECGFVGCCDQSVNKHMKKHSEATGHVIFRSIQPDEAWIWCYADNAFLSSRHLPRAVNG
jgi:predicted ester cyclase